MQNSRSNGYRFSHNKSCTTARQPTKRALDGWDSAAFSGFIYAQAESCSRSFVHARPPASNANRWASGRLKEQKINRLAGVGLVPAVSFEGVSVFKSLSVCLQALFGRVGWLFVVCARVSFSGCLGLPALDFAHGVVGWLCPLLRSGLVRRRVSSVEFVCPPALSGQGGLPAVLREVSAGVWVMSVCQPSLLGQVGWLAV
jgi:hypothetical protein